MITRNTRLRQLLAGRRAMLQVFLNMSRVLETHLAGETLLPFSLADVKTLLDNVSESTASVDALLSLVGSCPESDEDAHLLAVLHSPEGEAAARSFLRLHAAVDSAGLSLDERFAPYLLQLAPNMVQEGVSTNLFRAFGRQAEAIHETLWAQLGLHFLQFWVLPNGSFHCSGDAEAFSSVASGEVT